MNDPRDLKRSLVYAGITVINDCVEKLPTWELRSEAIQQLREHLEARAEQCRPLGDLDAPGMAEALAADAEKLRAMTIESAGYDPDAPWPSADELNPANWPERGEPYTFAAWPPPVEPDNSDLV